MLFNLLGARFPAKEASDEMSEIMTAVFNLRAAEGETLKTWVSRASELFDRCQRKTNVSFPEEARGWIILHRSGLNDEQKAVCLARSLGVLKREEIAKAMRSCYAEFVTPRRKSYAAGLIETDRGELTADHEEHDEAMQEVEQFLAEHQLAEEGEEPGDDEHYDESEVAEALAVTWRDKRKELNRLQKERKFKQAGEVKRSFQIEVSELKKKTRCHRCQQIGHWARDCHLPPPPKGKGKGKSRTPLPPTGAAVVEHVPEYFIATVMPLWPTLTRLRDQKNRDRGLPIDSSTKHKDIDNSALLVHGDIEQVDNSTLFSKHVDIEQVAVEQVDIEQSQEALLVSSPGFGVLDSGCGRSIIGERTLQSFEQLWRDRNQTIPSRIAEKNLFKYGNGEQEVSQQAVQVPVVLGGRMGSIRAAIVKGDAPLLISRAALQKLNAVINFSDSTMTLFTDQRKIPLQTNEAGQFVVRLIDDSAPITDQP